MEATSTLVAHLRANGKKEQIRFLSKIDEVKNLSIVLALPYVTVSSSRDEQVPPFQRPDLFKMVTILAWQTVSSILPSSPILLAIYENKLLASFVVTGAFC